MDTRTLQLFLSLSDTLHFGRASAFCHISASALSRTIKQLEEEVGVSLFIRDNRSVQLTHEGKLFQAYARDALAQWELTRNTLLEEAKELRGEVSIYCSVTASYSFLYDILSQFRQNFPSIEIKLHTGDPDLALSRVQNNEEDISIAAKPDQLPKDLTFKPIGISPLLFIAPKKSSAQSEAITLPLSTEQWSHVPMILSEGGVSRDRIDEWFRQLETKPNIYAQVAGNEAIVSMVSLGFGVGVVPKIVLDNSPLADKIEILCVTPKLKPYEVGLFTLEKKLKNPLINALWSQIKTSLP
ncbi:HTH-type transcriptional activator IlvY [Neptunomonas japonica]|uniref:HTH-type transcriptional activator IlvY n=1 Tax=Neptunomonas japonica TaxID=417574 RepID=UPI0004063B06|nr:HTH-type transcriptional activator IlvY [Neptunomonas japonica]